MPILQGMNVVSMVVDNEFMRGRIEQMRDGVERGESILRTAVTAGVFNPVVLQMIAVGEESGDMDGLMFEVAGMYEREVKYESEDPERKDRAYPDHRAGYSGVDPRPGRVPADMGPGQSGDA